MVVRESMFDEFFKHKLPDDGFTLEAVYDEYFGLLEKTRGERPELHGHVVTMDGHVVPLDFKPAPALPTPPPIIPGTEA